MRSVHVIASGALCTVQDLGRLGYLSYGVGTSGAADRASYQLANRLVGNVAGAAVLECLLGGLAIRANDPVQAAVTGAPAQAFVDGIPVGHASVVRLAAGQTMRLAAPATGLRSYLALRGGVAVEPVLGSRSTDTLSGIGPSAVTAGSVVPIGDDVSGYPMVDAAPVPTMTADPIALRVVLGPREDWFADPGVLAEGSWTVSTHSDRIGMRLDRPSPDNPPIVRARTGELAPEGAPLGAVQIPPSGQPVVFLADHPVSGGYPVIAVVRSADVDRASQARPGQGVRFVIA